MFLSSSTNRYNLFRLKVKELDINRALALRNLSMTRWIARADSIRAVWRSFEGVIAALEALDESEGAKTKMKAAGLLKRVKKFDFVVMLMFMKNVMVKTKILTQELQSVETTFSILWKQLKLPSPHCSICGMISMGLTRKFRQHWFLVRNVALMAKRSLRNTINRKGYQIG